DGDTYAHPDRSLVPMWSPDSKWLAYSKRLETQFLALMLWSAAHGKARQITDGMADATSPAWDASGKYLWFFGSTNLGLLTGWIDMSSYERPLRRALYVAGVDKNGKALGPAA